MGIAYVNNIYADYNDTNTGTSVTFTANVGGYAGTVIAVCCTNMSTASTTATFSDSKGNTWTVDNGPIQPNNDFIVVASTRQNVGTLLQSDHITVTFSHSRSGGAILIAAVFSGVLTSSYADGTANNSSSSTTGPIQGGTVTPSQDGDLIMSAMCIKDAGNTISWSDGATGTIGTYLNDNFNNTAGVVTHALVQDYQILTAGNGVAQRQYFTASSPTSFAALTTAYKAAPSLTPAFTDNTGLTDSISVTYGRTFSDNAGSTDTMIATKGVFSDSAGSVDSLVVEIDRLVSFSDDSGSSDSLTKVEMDRIVSFTDNAGSTDTMIALGTNLLPSFTDNAGSTDSVTVTKNPGLLDNTGVTDSFFVERDITITSSTPIPAVEVRSNFRGNAPSASGALAIITITTGSTLGNTLILTAATRQTTYGTTVIVTDTKNNTWTVDNGPAQTSSDHVFTASTRQDGGALVAGIDMLFITYSNQRSAGVAIDIREFSGILLSAPNYTDAINNFGIDFIDAIAGPTNVGLVTPSVNSDVLIAALVADTGPTVTTNTGGTVGTYVDIAALLTDSGITQKQLVSAYQVPPTGIAVSQQFDVTFSSPVGYQGILTAYYAASLIVPWDSAGSTDTMVAERDLSFSDNAGSSDASLVTLLTHTPPDPMDLAGSVDSLAIERDIVFADDSGSSDSIAIEDDVVFADDSGSTDSHVEVYP